MGSLDLWTFFRGWLALSIANPNIAFFPRQDFRFNDGFSPLRRPCCRGGFPVFNLVLVNLYLRICIDRKVIRVPNVH